MLKGSKQSARMAVFVGVALLALGSLSIQAQNKEAADARPQMIDVTTVEVKPGMVGEFERFIRDEWMPAHKRGGGKTVHVWQTAGFGDAFTYVFVSPIDKMAQLDSPPPLMRAIGADKMEAFYKKAGSMVTSVRSVAAVERQDLTYEGSMTGPPKMTVVAIVKVNQGRDAEFENFIKNEYLPVFKKSDAKAFWMSQTVFGGSPNEYVMLTPIDNFADLDKGHPIARVVGRDGHKKLMAKLPAGTVESVQVLVMRLNPEMSIMETATAQN